MPGPIRNFEFLTNDELAALRATVISQLTSGRFTSLSGAQKSSSQEWLDLSAQLQSLNLEFKIRNGVRRPQKVVNILHRGCYSYGSNISIP